MSHDGNDTKSENATTTAACVAENQTPETHASAPRVAEMQTAARDAIVRTALAEACKQAIDLLAETKFDARSILAAVGDELMWKASKL